MGGVCYYQINEDEAGQRLDNYLIRILKGVPRSHIYRIIRAGEVRVNKKRAQVKQKLVAGDSVRVPPVRCSESKEIFVGEKLQQLLHKSIVFEDKSLLVINKPSGFAVHGGSNLSLGVIEALRKSRPDLIYLELVHRLDRDTSGILLIAKKRSVLRALQALFTNREVQKTYWLIAHNHWGEPENIQVNLSLQKNIVKSGERVVVVSETGKPSSTDFSLIENFQASCWVQARPSTGRTHQIRVHSAALNHSIVGDDKYGNAALDLGLVLDKMRLYLHAHSIQFNLNGITHCYEAELDKVFANTLSQLRVRREVRDK